VISPGSCRDAMMQFATECSLVRWISLRRRGSQLVLRPGFVAHLADFGLKLTRSESIDGYMIDTRKMRFASTAQRALCG
jgi:hypothetical protein